MPLKYVHNCESLLHYQIVDTTSIRGQDRYDLSKYREALRYRVDQGNSSNFRSFVDLLRADSSGSACTILVEAGPLLYSQLYHPSSSSSSSTPDISSFSIAQRQGQDHRPSCMDDTVVMSNIPPDGMRDSHKEVISVTWQEKRETQWQWRVFERQVE